MSPREMRQLTPLERISVRATRWVGSTQSLVVHTMLFAVSFLLVLFGFEFDKILLVVTTIVSLEAIYLSIFIQMSVNRQGRRLREVSKDIEEIQEDVEGIEKDVDEIQRDVDEIQEDVEDITEGVDVHEQEEKVRDETLIGKIEQSLALLTQEIQELKKKK